MRSLIIILGLFCVISLSCKKESNDGQQVALSLMMNISFLDDENNDLLDPAYPHSIQERDIEIYYLRGDEKVRVYDANLDHPKNFNIGTLADRKYYLQLSVSDIPNQDTVSTTYIEVKDQPLDTLTSKLRISNASKVVTQAWYNGDLKWDGKKLPTFTVIK